MVCGNYSKPNHTNNDCNNRAYYYFASFNHCNKTAKAYNNCNNRYKANDIFYSSNCSFFIHFLFLLLLLVYRCLHYYITIIFRYCQDIIEKNFYFSVKFSVYSFVYYTRFSVKSSVYSIVYYTIINFPQVAKYIIQIFQRIFRISVYYTKVSKTFCRTVYYTDFPDVRILYLLV